MKIKKNKVIIIGVLVVLAVLVIEVSFDSLMVTMSSPQRSEIVADPVQNVIEKLWDPNPQEICNSIIMLKRLKNYRALPPLTLMLAHADERVRNTAARALLDLQDLDSVTELLNALNKPRLKVNAALLLGKTGDYRAIRGLTPLLADQNKEVQAAARSALDQLNSFQPQGRQKLPGFFQDHRLVIANDSSIMICRFLEKENKFVVETSTPLKSTRYLMVDPGNMVEPGEKQITAVTLERAVVFDTRLKVLMEKELPDPGAAAVYRDYLLVSDSGYLKALHLRRNLEEIAQIPLIRHRSPMLNQRKNAHDIIIYRDTAYILDNIIYPVFILKVNLRDLDRGKLEETKNIGIEVYPVNFYPHLDGQWLDPGENRWVLLISAVDFFCGRVGVDKCQGLYFLQAYGEEKNLHHVKYPEMNIDFYLIERDLKMVMWDFGEYDYLLYTSKIYKYTPVIKEKMFWIWAVTAQAPPWALIEKNNRYYLVRITVKRRNKFSNDPLYRVILSRYCYIGHVDEFSKVSREAKAFHIRNHGRFVFITIGERLLVIEAGHGVMPLLQQNLGETVRDFLVL